MSRNRLARRFLAAALLVAVCLPGWFLAPGQAPAALAATSADPDEEIVYLDNEGVIRVLDTKGSTLVRWFSPVGGFVDVALADVNADGEYEILGVRQLGATGMLYVFDPVIASGTIKPDQRIPPVTGIPWDTLYTQQIPGKPAIVSGGNFDLNVPGDEILFGYLRDDGKFIITVLKGTSLTPDGRTWTPHIPAKEFDNPWDQVDSGDINGKGAHDVVLVDSESDNTRVGFYEIDGDMARIDGLSSRGSPWKSARLGQVRSGGIEEIILTRSSELASLLIFRYNPDNGSVEEQSSSDLFVFVPNPSFGFPADLTGNSDDEVFILRRHPQASGVRMIMRNEWGDDRNNTVKIELPLDADNGYRVGAGGDVDGDGKDEVVIMRDNNLRVYTSPDSTVNEFNNYGLPTDRENLVLGDLDRLGFVQGPQFGVNVSRVEATIPTGTESAAFPVQISNISTNEPIPFNIRTPLPSWVSVTPLSGQTPAIIEITFDATAPLAIGKYEATLSIDSSIPAVVNKPFPLDVALTVGPAELIANPTSAIFHFGLPIDPQADNLRTAVFDVGGTAGLKYTAAVLEVPPGVSAQQLAASVSAARNPAGDLVVTDGQGRSAVLSAQGASAAGDGWPIVPTWVITAHSSSMISGTATVPDSLELTVDGGAIAGDALVTEAVVVLVPDARAGSPATAVRALPIAVIRSDQRIYLPLVASAP